MVKPLLAIPTKQIFTHSHKLGTWLVSIITTNTSNDSNNNHMNNQPKYAFEHIKGKIVISHLFSQKYRNTHNHVTSIILILPKKNKATLYKYTKTYLKQFNIQKIYQNKPNIYKKASRPEVQVKRREPLWRGVRLMRWGVRLFEEAHASSVCWDCPGYLKRKKPNFELWDHALHAIKSKYTTSTTYLHVHELMLT